MMEKTKSERGYAGTGRLLHRILHTLVGVYPINARFVNSDEWDDGGVFFTTDYRTRKLIRSSVTEFNRDHDLYWGRLYSPEDVKIEWHSRQPVSFHAYPY